MNVYKIGKFHIAAKNTDSAFYKYLDETDGSDFVFFELDEGESDEYTVTIRRLTSKEMDSQFITCCFDGCELCEGKDEPILFSPKEMMQKQEKFPCVICREE